MDSRLARWLALAAFAVLIAGWFAAALYLTGASAGEPGSRFNLRSNLAADYGPDDGRRITSLRISIITDLLHDLGIGGEDAALLSELDSPVPTATARNFQGDPPFTATVTPSATPTATPTVTLTPTPKPPTRTPTPTDTEPPEATEAPADLVAPSISGGTLFPDVGTLLPGCDGNDFSITGLHIVDPGPSSGIAWVKLKYVILGPGSTGYQFSSDLGPPVSGGWSDGPGSTWDAYYKGDHTINFADGYALGGGGKLFRPMPGRPAASAPPFTVEVWSIVEDNAGNQSFTKHGEYLLPGDCGG